MCARQRIDMLTSESWLCEQSNPERSAMLKMMIIDESCNHQIASAYTTMVGIKTTQAKIGRFRQRHNKKSKTTKSSAGFIGCAVGSVVLLGAGAGMLSFGSVSATMDNLLLANSFGATQELGPAF